MRGVPLLFVAIAAASLALALNPPHVRPGNRSLPTLVDMNGRSVSLPAAPARMVVLTPRLADYLTIDDGASHLAGTTRIALTSLRDSELDAFYPEARAIPSLATVMHPDDPERLLLARPDAVLAWPDAVPLLESLGIPGVISLKGDPNDAHGITWRTWTLLGSVTRRSERVSHLLAQGDAHRLAVSESLKGSPPGPRIVVLYPGQGVGQIGGRYNHLNSAIHAVGASDPADDRTITADSSLEQLFELDPDMILLTTGYPRAPAALYADPQWQPLRAARERRIYLIPALADVGSPVDESLFVRWLAELTHGMRLSADWRGMAQGIYREVYGKALSDEAIDALLHLHDNLASRDYERFAAKPSHTVSGATPHD